tara:strand:- start:1221 stop:1358 length:138 start_codon:yes stop_codon:yes gene_type:complete
MEDETNGRGREIYILTWAPLQDLVLSYFDLREDRREAFEASWGGF